MFGWLNKFLAGKKTIISGIGAVGAFLTVIATQLQDGFQMGDIQPILVAFTVAMGIFGFGDKLFKLTEALKGND